MSLIKCIECGSELSEFAKFCPKCGCPMEKIKKENLSNINSNAEEISDILFETYLNAKNDLENISIKDVEKKLKSGEITKLEADKVIDSINTLTSITENYQKLIKMKNNKNLFEKSEINIDINKVSSNDFISKSELKIMIYKSILKEIEKYFNVSNIKFYLNDNFDFVFEYNGKKNVIFLKINLLPNIYNCFENEIFNNELFIDNNVDVYFAEVDVFSKIKEFYENSLFFKNDKYNVIFKSIEKYEKNLKYNLDLDYYDDSWKKILDFDIKKFKNNNKKYDFNNVSFDKLFYKSSKLEKFKDVLEWLLNNSRNKNSFLIINNLFRFYNNELINYDFPTDDKRQFFKSIKNQISNNNLFETNNIDLNTIFSFSIYYYLTNDVKNYSLEKSFEYLKKEIIINPYIFEYFGPITQDIEFYINKNSNKYIEKIKKIKNQLFLEYFIEYKNIYELINSLIKNKKSFDKEKNLDVFFNHDVFSKSEDITFGKRIDDIINFLKKGFDDNAPKNILVLRENLINISSLYKKNYKNEYIIYKSYNEKSFFEKRKLLKNSKEYIKKLEEEIKIQNK